MAFKIGFLLGKFSSNYWELQNFICNLQGAFTHDLRYFCAVGLFVVHYLRGFGLKTLLLKVLPSDCPLLAVPSSRILYMFFFGLSQAS